MCRCNCVKSPAACLRAASWPNACSSGGLAVAGLNVATGAAGGALVGAASSTAGRVAVAAVVGASSGAAGDAATQAAHMGGGIQSGYDLQQTATSAAVGGALGAGSVPLANAIKSSLDRRTVARALAKELQTTRSEERRVGKECRSRWSPY